MKNETIDEINAGTAWTNLHREQADEIREYIKVNRMPLPPTALSLVRLYHEKVKPTLCKHCRRGQWAHRKPREDCPGYEASGDHSQPDQAVLEGVPGFELPPEADPEALAAAAEIGLDLRTVRGTGPGGRILYGDLQRHLAEKMAKIKATAGAMKEKIATELGKL